MKFKSEDQRKAAFANMGKGNQGVSSGSIGSGSIKNDDDIVKHAEHAKEMNPAVKEGLKDVLKEIDRLNKKFGESPKRMSMKEDIEKTINYNFECPKCGIHTDEEGLRLHNKHFHGGKGRIFGSKLTFPDYAQKVKKYENATEWGFDLTDFKKNGFQEVLSELGISHEAKDDMSEIGGKPYRRGFIWQGSGIKIVTGNNPITGEYTRPEQRENDKDYASYIGVEGQPEKVAQAIKLIKKHASDIKDESKGRRDFI